MKIVIFLSLVLCWDIFPEELVVIRAISSTKKSFVLPLGMKDGISPGQESLFSTENLSVIATAKEVSRNQSYWELNDKDAMVPFKIDQFVGFSNNLETLLYEIPLIKFKEKELVYMGKNKWLLRIGYYGTLSETVSSVSASQFLSSNGYSIDGIYLIDLTKKMNLGIGLRYDSDSSQNSQPQLIVPSYRVLLEAEVQYKFEQFKGTNNSFYGAMDLGIGLINSQISTTTSSGISVLIPGIRFGIDFTLSKNTSLVTEMALENILSFQNFQNGTEQDSNELDLKLSIGIKF